MSMAPKTPLRLPKIRTDDTFDPAPLLQRDLPPNGIIQVDIQNGEEMSTIASVADADKGGTSTSLLNDSTDSEEEDYDALKLDTSAVVEGSRGGDLETDMNNGVGDVSPLLDRRPSISIKLEKTQERGRYLLTAKDPEIRDILRRILDKDSQISSPFGGPRTKIQDLVFTRRFTAFDRSNPSGDRSPFFGFFTLFWIFMGLLLINVAAKNWRTYGNVFGNTELLGMMFNRELYVVALTDGAMVGSTVVPFLLQLIVAKGYLDWNSSGWIVEHVWQTLWLVSVISWTFYREWPWTHTVFMVLHAFCFLMKQHSYAFYNGYLSEVYKRKQALEKKYWQLDTMSPETSPVRSRPASSSHKSPPTCDFASSGFGNTLNASGNLRRRSRRESLSLQNMSSPGQSSDLLVNLAEDTSEIASIAETISSGQALDEPQMYFFKNTISKELHALETELKGKCTTTQNYYPKNLSFSNFTEWSVLPTLVYELEYPRQEKVNWAYVAEKTGATFGTLAIMQVISQAYIYPLVVETVRMKAAGMSLQDRWLEFPWVILDLLFPMMLEQLLSWYVIWECVLNVVAELTRFADRGFYGAWWNSVSFADYARDWNKPVHNFLLRHVYHSSISALRLSKTMAMLMTFLLSACIHELLMFCLFKKVRGYLFGMQLMQLPLAAFSKTKVMRNQPILGNILFWFGIFVGPAIITSLYLIV